MPVNVPHYVDRRGKLKHIGFLGQFGHNSFRKKFDFLLGEQFRPFQFVFELFHLLNGWVI